MWFPEQFIMAQMPQVAKLMDKKLVQTLATNRHSFLQNKSQSCVADVKAFHLQVGFSFPLIVVIGFQFFLT